MKVTTKAPIKGLRGKLDGAVYYYHPRIKKVIMRRTPKLPHLPQHDRMKAISRNIRDLEISDAYKNDWRSYLTTLRERDEDLRLPSWYPLFIKLLWEISARYEIDLETLSREQIISLDLPCRSIRRAIEEGLLAKVPGWEYLDHQI